LVETGVSPLEYRGIRFQNAKLQLLRYLPIWFAFSLESLFYAVIVKLATYVPILEDGTGGNFMHSRTQLLTTARAFINLAIASPRTVMSCRDTASIVHEMFKAITCRYHLDVELSLISFLVKTIPITFGGIYTSPFALVYYDDPLEPVRLKCRLCSIHGYGHVTGC
jgi:hypothetical protein